MKENNPGKSRNDTDEKKKVETEKKNYSTPTNPPTPKRPKPPQIKKKRVLSRINTRDPTIESDDEDVFAFASQLY